MLMFDVSPGVNVKKNIEINFSLLSPEIKKMANEVVRFITRRERKDIAEEVVLGFLR